MINLYNPKLTNDIITIKEKKNTKFHCPHQVCNSNM